VIKVEGLGLSHRQDVLGVMIEVTKWVAHAVIVGLVASLGG
jgi:hypothetical protein